MTLPRLTTARVPARLLGAMALVVAACLAVPALLEHPDWLPLGLAAAALALSLFAVLRGHFLEFAPEVLAGDVILPRSSRAGGGVKFLLPLQFTNAGAADGVVHWVAARLTIDGDVHRSVLLSPVAEVDMRRFIEAKRRLDAENTIDPFTSFVLEGRKSAAKFVLFELAEQGRGEPVRLRPGRYAFELFIKASGMRGPKLARSFEHVLEQRHLDDYQGDSTVYLINYHITLPGVRREVAGLEWLPRAREARN